MNKKTYSGYLQSIIQVIEDALGKESYRVDFNDSLLTSDQKWELYDLTVKVNELLSNALYEKNVVKNISLHDYILESKASTSIQELIKFSQYFEENVKNSKGLDITKYAIERLSHLHITSKRSKKTFEAYVKSREAAMCLNKCIWHDACEEIKAIKELLGELANVEDGSINKIIIKHQEHYFSENFSTISNEITKEMHDVDNDGHCIVNFSDTNITKNQWLELLNHLYSSLRKQKFDFLVDWDHNVIHKADNQLMIDFLMSTDSSDDYDEAFYLLSKINIIKSKINPSITLISHSPYNFKKKLDRILPLISCQRHWFCVIKAMFEKHYFEDNDFISAVEFVQKCYPEGVPYGINQRDLTRMGTLSFSKHINFWEEKDAPVSGAVFTQYKKIAEETLKIL